MWMISRNTLYLKRITNLPQLKLWKIISSGKTLSLQHQILYIATRMKIMIHSFFSDDLPHVYFVGNQQQFDSKLLEHDGVNVRLISIPKFKESGQFVLLDLDTLETEVVTIEI